MERYNIYFRKYVIFGRAYGSYVKVVYTDDIYHEIGKIICKSLEHIDSIRYTKPRASVEACEKLWLESGYKKISDNFYMSEHPFKESSPPDLDIDKNVLLKALTHCGELASQLNSYIDFFSKNLDDFKGYEVEAIDIFEKCEIKDGCLYDSDGKLLSDNDYFMKDDFPYFRVDLSGFDPENYALFRYYKVDRNNTFVCFCFSKTLE